MTHIPKNRVRPIFGCISLFLLAVVVPGVVLILLGTFDQPAPLPERFINTERLEKGIVRVLSSVLILLSAGVVGIALAALSILKKERPLWIPILALSIGALPFGVTFIIVTIILLNI